MRSIDASVAYHLQELEIARASSDARHSLPLVAAGDAHILDVGCGIGQTLLALKLPPGTEAHGADIDQSATTFGTANYPGLRLTTASGEALPYGDAIFELVICRLALPYMHIPRAMREFARVLVPHGRLWLEVHPPSRVRSDLAVALKQRSARGVAYRLYALANTLALAADRQFRYPLNRERIESYQPAMLVRRTLRRSGFTNIRTWTENGHSFATASRHT